MPPPSVVDPWLAARRFGIVIDAGSSGSRLQIYSWKDPRTVLLEGGNAVSSLLPKVEKGAQKGEEWVSKIQPGLSSFVDDPDGVEQHLAPLLRHARDQIPPSLHKETPLFLLATAGMRLVSPIKQAAILKSACQFLRLHSHFRLDDPSNAGPCGSSVRIITGEEEGLFGWIAVNYLMDGFTASDTNRTTYGFLDMGGASTQIAFEPKHDDRSLAKKLINVRLRLLGGDEIHHQVFVTTWLGYGTNQARERYVSQVIDQYQKNQHEALKHDSDDIHVILDPCLPKDLERLEHPIRSDPTSLHTLGPQRLRGTGSFEACLRQTSSLLNKDAPCPDSPCLFNGIHVPPIDFSVSHFIGVSEYWYASEHVFGLGGPYDFLQYERAASEFCSRDWSGIVKQHQESRQDGRLGGDGEVLEHGKVIGTGKWGKEVEISRLEVQCFKAAWIANVLHEGIGMPRIVDPGGNSTTRGEKVAEQAERKGLGRPTFQSVDTVGDIAISWTLGKMVLEASKEIPPSSKTARPLGDPLDDIADSADAPVKPIRPPFFDLDLLENRLSSHLPSSLHRSALGFSPLLFLIYTTLLFILLVVACRLKFAIAASFRRTPHSRNKKSRDIEAKGYLMDESKSFTSPGPPPLSPFNPWRLWHRIRLSSTFATSKLPRSGYDQRSSPNLSTSLPSLPSVTSGLPQPHATSSTSSQYSSRLPSPVRTGQYEEAMLSSSPASFSSRSRNASQHNLAASCAPRPGTLSRLNSTSDQPWRLVPR